MPAQPVGADDNAHDEQQQAFQRRFDPPLHYAKELLDSGIIGRVFKTIDHRRDVAHRADLDA